MISWSTLQRLWLALRGLFTSNRLIAFSIIVVALAGSPSRLEHLRQQPFPDPPNDLTRIYYLSGERKLLPLPFESGLASLNVFVPATATKIIQVRVKGST